VGGAAASGVLTVDAFAPDVRISGVQRTAVGALVFTGFAPVVITPRPVRVVVSAGPAYVSAAAPDVVVTTRISWTDDDEDDEIGTLLLLVAALNA
jgi:hypothetical protein